MGPGCVESRPDAMILLFESADGSGGCRALWRVLTGAKARFSHPCLTTTWARTIRFVRLTLLSMGSILAGLALVGLYRWNKGGLAIIRRRCSRYTFMAISIASHRADGLSVSASAISS